MTEERKQISVWSILFALFFYAGSVWANDSGAVNAGAFCLLMAVMFGVTAILSVITSRVVILVLSTVVMLFVGAYFITPIASEAIQEMITLLIDALLQAIDSVGWVMPTSP